MHFAVFITLLTIWLTTGCIECAQISFNATRKYGVHYFVDSGDDVVLTCELPARVRNADIYKKVYPFHYITLVEEGVLQENEDKHNLTISNDGDRTEYRLTIRDLDDYDTAEYGCMFCVRRRWEWFCPYDFAFLHVVENVDTTTESCTLVTGTDGVFFFGDNLTLSCTTENLHILFNETDVTSNVTSDSEGGRQIYQIEVVDGSFNGTTISCVEMADAFEFDDSEKDYCEDLPTISVFSTLKVKISPETKEIPNGGNISFTCNSSPNIISSVEWDLPDSNIILENSSIIETTEGLRLSIENIDFQNVSSFEVTCSIMIGSRNDTSVATIYKKMISTVASITNSNNDESTMKVTTSTVTTTLPRKVNSTVGQTSEKKQTTESMGDDSNRSSSRVAVTIIPIAVILVIICIIIAVIVYVCFSKKSKRTGSDVKGKFVTQGKGSEGNAYQLS